MYSSFCACQGLYFDPYRVLVSPSLDSGLMASGRLAQPGDLAANYYSKPITVLTFRYKYYFISELI